MTQNNETDTREQPHSTEISINAKGQWSGKVKVYGLTPEEAYKTALTYASQLEERIRQANEG